ncbi:MAG TPA: RNA-directed DNA polymerase [Candidatus Alistipes merdavium]|nr:RNA-directed DNA polymerase [Candidatus Alistipes merdavium]
MRRTGTSLHADLCQRVLCRLIADLLTNPHVALPDGQITCERKGIMAGVPLASFLANLYLNDLDWHFHRQGMLYARYSDDIILFASSAEEREMAIDYLHDYLQAHRLTINEKKEVVTGPSQKCTFLGVSFENGVFDVSEVSASKLKMKMRRKSHALLRWKARKGVDNDKAARAFVKAFNRKLYDNDAENELSWSRWFFPIINTTRTLTLIDHYMQDCLRYIATEKRTKGRYRFTYEEMKALGYRNLVHEYYRIQEQKIAETN